MAAPFVWAEEEGEGAGFRVSGFGTLGYVHETSRELSFQRDSAAPPRLEASPLKRGLLLDSRAGFQLTCAPEADWSGVVQVVATDRAEQKLADALTWAFFSWHPGQDWNLRVGRLGVDVHLLGDHRDVGYTYTWVRPVSEVYGWMPLRSLDGVDATRSLHVGEWFWQFKFAGGQSRQAMAVTDDQTYVLRLWPCAVVGVTAEHDHTLWKATVARFRFCSQIPQLEPLVGPLSDLAASGVPDAGRLMGELRFEGTWGTFLSLGGTHDVGNWSFAAELVHLAGESYLIPAGWCGYVSAAHRWGVLEPYLVFAQARPSRDALTSLADWSSVGGAPLQAAALDLLWANRIDQSTLSLGVRWDVARRMALKFQYDRSHVVPSGKGLWVSAGGGASGGADVLTATLDWVF